MQFHAPTAAATTPARDDRDPHVLDPHAQLLAAERASASGAWAVGFVLFEIACQLLLLIPLFSPARVVFRSAAFAGSMVLAGLFPRLPQNRFHPATGWAILAIALVALGIFNPSSNTTMSCLATIAMYFAVLGPLFWATGLAIDERWLRRVIITIWAFNALSAGVAVLQTLFPDQLWLQPNLSAVIENMRDGGEAGKISLVNGAQVFRPMGLSDQPGAAALAGLACIVFGTALLCRSRNVWFWGACLGSMVMGLFCILLSQVRSVLVMTGVSVIAFSTIMVLRGDVRRLARVSLALAGVAVIASLWAVAIAGRTVTDRLSTLVEDDPREVYYQNRGHFLQYTFTEALPRWPLGAGLGRWGMMNFYFGDPDLPASPTLWAELMWTGWTYDGGLPLMATYVIAIAVALWQAFKLGRVTRGGSIGGGIGGGVGGDVGLWAAVIFAFNIGCVAVTFNYPLFMGQTGLDFWLLNAALLAAAQTEQRRHAATAARAAAAAALPSQVVQPSRGPRSLLDMNG